MYYITAYEVVTIYCKNYMYMFVPDLDFPLKLTVKLPWTGGEAVSVLTTDTTPPATT